MQTRDERIVSAVLMTTWFRNLGHVHLLEDLGNIVVLIVLFGHTCRGHTFFVHFITHHPSIAGRIAVLTTQRFQIMVEESGLLLLVVIDLLYFLVKIVGK